MSVKTGSLSKQEFIAKADAICEAARSEFSNAYTNFVQTHTADLGKKQKEDALMTVVVKTIISPNFEGEIKKISALGAPSEYESEASSFLNTLQTQLSETQEDPTKLEGVKYPFEESAEAAKEAGLQGCAESFG